MNFPADPINGQTTTINGIVYIYDSTKTAWKRSTSFAGNLTILGNITSANVVTGNVFTSGGIYWSNNGAAYSSGSTGSSNFLYTAASTKPTGPTKGDQWFDTTDGTLYEYIDDGDSLQWVDIQTPTVTSDAITTLLSGDVSTDGNVSASSIVITSGIYWANGTAFASSVYSNVNVEAYIGANIGAYQTYANANIGTLFLDNISTQANLGTLFLGNISTQANLGTLFLSNISTQSNLGSLYNSSISTQANLGTLFLGNASTQANLGAFQTFSNANAATQATAINTINANLGAYQTYANTIIYSNANVVANLQNFVTSINTTANIRTTANVIAPNYLFANGVNILSTVSAGSTYSNTNVAAYLTQGANIGSGTTTTNLVATATTTSISTTTGALVVQGGAGVVGNLYVGNEFVVPGGGKITSTGLAYLLEKANVVAATPATTVNVDMSTVSVMYWTSNATANVTANIRGSATQTLNSLLATGQSVTAVLFFPNGASNFLVNTVKIDNTTVPVAYQGNAAPVLGNSNSIDIYSFTILKTASATYKIFASQTQFMHPG